MHFRDTCAVWPWLVARFRLPSTLPRSRRPAISSEVLGKATPATVANPELSLGRVTVMPGAALSVHYHPGTQIGVVVQGELTYSSHRRNRMASRRCPTGSRTGSAQERRSWCARVTRWLSPPSRFTRGATMVLGLVIYLSTLFPAEAPRAIVVEATRVP